MGELRSSRLEGFYKLTIQERLEKVGKFADLTSEEIDKILSGQGLNLDQADRMIENVVGVFGLPLGIAVNFLINGKDYLIPMVIEEPSVVAAASYAAKIARQGGGFTTSSTDSIMIGQIQVVNVSDPFGAKMDILRRKAEIIDVANKQDPLLVSLGGGAKDVEVRVLDTVKGPMVIVHLLVDTKDAMGANATNTMCEAVAQDVEKITGGKVYLRILSNLADKRIVRAKTVIPSEALSFGPFSGEEVVDGIVEAYAFAAADPYRAATHNKGIMNGIDPVVIATGNDWRAVEAGAHAYATVRGRYTSLTVWEKDCNGNLVGSIELPMTVGLIGGATKVHPLTRISLKILGVKNARELGEVIAAVGLAQNLAALRALATEGIQRGHMELHARNVAASAGAEGDLIDMVAARMIKEKVIRLDRAKEILQEIRGK